MKSGKSGHGRVCAVLAGACVSVGFGSGARPAMALPIDYDTQNTYHWQQTNFYCGPSSMEMMLDCPQVRNNANVPAQVTNLLAGANDVAIQDNIYNSIHPLNFTPLFGPGTDPVGYSLGVNNYDGTNTASGHGYAWYGFAPTYAGAAYASKTVANSLADYNIPATVSVNNGGHWIDVSGVETRTAAGAGKNYIINGFFVKDPWTGFVQNQVTLGNYKVNNKGQAIDKTNNQVVPWGLGENTYLRYGYDLTSNGPLVTLPNGQQKNIRVSGWFRYFTPGGITPGKTANSIAPYSAQYITEVEPQAPELPDDGSNGDALPDPPTELLQGLTAAQAETDAAADLAADPSLSTLRGFSDGGFDSNAADEEFLSFGDDTGGQGDWLVPYDGAGGLDDVSGYALIDAFTGVIDQATYMDAGFDMTLSEVEAAGSELESANQMLVSDNTVPEPSALALLTVAGVVVLRRRRGR